MKKRRDMYDRLIRAAQRLPEDEQVPYAFEKRIMAHLRPMKQVDNVTLWALGLWKAAVPCVAVMLLITTWATISTSAESSTEDSLAMELELTMTQPLQALEEIW
jgi:hypothetical protein